MQEIYFPNWANTLGWRASGTRTDRIGGRSAITVYYRRGPSRVAYEIVSGPPLKLGQPAGTVTRGGVVFRTLKSSRGPIVTWVRDGHTCVLLGSGTAVPVMLSLASYREGGRVPY